MANGSVSNKDLYNALEANRQEAKGDMLRVQAQLDTLQNGIIANMQKDINDIKIRNATFTTKFAVVGFISASVGGALVSALALKLIGVGH